MEALKIDPYTLAMLLSALFTSSVIIYIFRYDRKNCRAEIDEIFATALICIVIWVFVTAFFYAIIYLLSHSPRETIGYLWQWIINFLSPLLKYGIAGISLLAWIAVIGILLTLFLLSNQLRENKKRDIARLSRKQIIHGIKESLLMTYGIACIFYVVMIILGDRICDFIRLLKSRFCLTSLAVFAAPSVMVFCGITLSRLRTKLRENKRKDIARLSGEQVWDEIGTGFIYSLSLAIPLLCVAFIACFAAYWFITVDKVFLITYVKFFVVLCIIIIPAAIKS